MTLDPRALGRAIAEVRRLRGLTQRDVSTETGLAQTYISLVETGDRIASQATLNKVAGALRVPLQWIVFLAGETPRKGEASDALIDLDRSTKSTIRALLAAEKEAAAHQTAS
jgi:XRE family transcriptional regulator, regulator of sulfur utilization